MADPRLARVSAHQQFLGLVHTGHLDALDLTRGDWARSIELCRRYQELRLDLMDACIIAIAERLR